MDIDTLLSLFLLRGEPLRSKDIYTTMELLNLDTYKNDSTQRAIVSMLLAEAKASGYIKSTGRTKFKLYSLTEEGVKHLAMLKIESMILNHLTGELLRHAIK